MQVQARGQPARRWQTHGGNAHRVPMPPGCTALLRAGRGTRGLASHLPASPTQLDGYDTVHSMASLDHCT
jgi:hypothetical protein